MNAFPSRAYAWAHQVVQLRAARAFVSACEADGIAVLPVKGIVSAYTLYDDSSKRPLSDVDVRVVASDVSRVVRSCRARGWHLVQHMRSYANVVALVEGVPVDVEAHVGPPGLCNLHVSSMLERATWSEALGFRCRIPALEDHATLLIVNAFKDKLSMAFEWALRDLDQLPKLATFDAARVVERLRVSAVSTIGFIVADWMVEVRGASGWRGVRDALVPVRRAGYVRALRALWKRNAESLLSRVVTRSAVDSPMLRTLALAHMAAWQAEAVLSQLGATPYRRARSQNASPVAATSAPAAPADTTKNTT